MQPPTGTDHSVFQSLAEVLWLAFAMFGGVARYLDSYIRTGHIPKIGLLFAHAIVSGFSGYMVAQVMLRLYPDWALVAAGVGGYLGTHGLDWMATVIRSRIGGELKTPNSGEENKNGLT